MYGYFYEPDEMLTIKFKWKKLCFMSCVCKRIQVEIVGSEINIFLLPSLGLEASKVDLIYQFGVRAMFIQTSDIN